MRSKANRWNKPTFERQTLPAATTCGEQHVRFFRSLPVFRYFLAHSYHGLHFHGWQRQPNGRTVQGELERCLALLLRHEVNLIGAGRTDTGVHASRSFCHFDTEAPVSTDFLYRLNGILPPDIGAPALYLGVPDADGKLPHARFSATSRSYTYTIARYKQPLHDAQAWLLTHPLDKPLLLAAAQQLLSYTDFASFTKAGGNQQTTFCTLFQSEWEEAGGLLRYHVKANRFLRGMVRALVGTQVEIASHRLPLQNLDQLVRNQDRRLAGPTVQAKGLALVDVAYPEGVLQLVQHL